MTKMTQAKCVPTLGSRPRILDCSSIPKVRTCDTTQMGAENKGSAERNVELINMTLRIEWRVQYTCEIT